MIDKLAVRVQWIEQNLLPREAEIRVWLKRRHVREGDIDDIIQEMYARVGSVEDLEGIRSPKSYAIRVAYSIFLNQIRKPHIVTNTKDGELNNLTVASLDASPEDEIAFKDEVHEVIAAIAVLPRRTREVLLLRRVEGLSQRETARRLAIAEKTVEKHLARAAVALMEQFGRGGKPTAQASTSVELTGRRRESDDTAD
jgi:RNA polymerase sigma-70 factor (ECF subfamily)